MKQKSSPPLQLLAVAVKRQTPNAKGQTLAESKEVKSSGPELHRLYLVATVAQQGLIA